MSKVILSEKVNSLYKEVKKGMKAWMVLTSCGGGGDDDDAWGFTRYVYNGVENMTTPGAIPC